MAPVAVDLISAILIDEPKGVHRSANPFGVKDGGLRTPMDSLIARGIILGGIKSLVLICPCANVPAIHGGSGIVQLWQFVGVDGPWTRRRMIRGARPAGAPCPTAPGGPRTDGPAACCWTTWASSWARVVSPVAVAGAYWPGPNTTSLPRV